MFRGGRGKPCPYGCELGKKRGHPPLNKVGSIWRWALWERDSLDELHKSAREIHISLKEIHKSVREICISLADLCSSLFHLPIFSSDLYKSERKTGGRRREIGCVLGARRSSAQWRGSAIEGLGKRRKGSSAFSSQDSHKGSRPDVNTLDFVSKPALPFSFREFVAK